MLNNFFQSVFTQENRRPLPDFLPYEVDSVLKDMDISIGKVHKILQGLAIGKAAGPDSIPPSILLQAACELAKPLTILFRRSLDHGILPTD